MATVLQNRDENIPIIAEGSRSTTLHRQILEITPEQFVFFSGFHWRPQAMTSILPPQKDHWVAILRESAIGQTGDQRLAANGHPPSQGFVRLSLCPPRGVIIPDIAGEATHQNVSFLWAEHR